MLTALLLLLPLALDTFAVGVSLGAAGLTRARWLRVGMTFAVVEAIMPLVGLAVGAHVARSFSGVATYVAGVLLIGVGLWELTETVRERNGSDESEESQESKEPSESKRGLLDSPSSLIIAALSVSMDELAIGFSFGALRVPLGLAVPYIGLQAFVATFAGLVVGERIGSLIGERAEMAAGIALIVLGVIVMVAK